MEYQGRSNGAYVFQVLTKPKMLGGVDRSIAVVLWALVAWMVLVFNNPWQLMLMWIGIGWATHFVLRFFFKREPLMFLIYKRYMKQSDIYVPWAEYRPRRGLRPIGFGRIKWKG